MYPGLLSDWSWCLFKARENALQITMLIYMVVIFLFFFFFLMLMISIFGTKLLLIMVSSHSKVKKAGSRRKLLLQQAHTALHLCGLKIKLSTSHLCTILFCRTSHLRLHSSTVYCKDVNKPASEAFTEIQSIFIEVIELSPSWIYFSVF